MSTRSQEIASVLAISLSAVGFSPSVRAQTSTEAPTPSWRELAAMSTDLGNHMTATTALADSMIDRAATLGSQAEHAALPIAPSLEATLRADLKHLDVAQYESMVDAVRAVKEEIYKKYQSGGRESRSEQQIAADLTNRALQNLAGHLGVSSERVNAILADVTGALGESGKLAAKELALVSPATEKSVTVNSNLRNEALFRMGAIAEITSSYGKDAKESRSQAVEQISVSLSQYCSIDTDFGPSPTGVSQSQNGVSNINGEQDGSSLKEQAKDFAKGKAKQTAEKMALTTVLMKFVSKAVARTVAGTVVNILQSPDANVGADLPSDPSDRRALEMASFMMQEIQRCEAARSAGGSPDYSNTGLNDKGGGGIQKDGGVKGYDKNSHVDHENPGGIDNVG